MQVREASGFGNGEAGGSVFTRVINITPASSAAGAGAEQTFAIVGSLGGDVLIAVSTSSAAQTTGVIVAPGRVTSSGQIGIVATYGAGTATATAATVLAGFYNVTLFRR